MSIKDKYCKLYDLKENLIDSILKIFKNNDFEIISINYHKMIFLIFKKSLKLKISIQFGNIKIRSTENDFSDYKTTYIPISIDTEYFISKYIEHLSKQYEVNYSLLKNFIRKLKLKAIHYNNECSYFDIIFLIEGFHLKYNKKLTSMSFFDYYSLLAMKLINFIVNEYDLNYMFVYNLIFQINSNKKSKLELISDIQGSSKELRYFESKYLRGNLTKFCEVEEFLNNLLINVLSLIYNYS